MPINRAQARKLCTEKEFELVDDSYHDRLGELTLVQARNKGKRAQKLLEQWKALEKKQGKGGTKTTNAAARRGEESPQRIRQKVELFQQATDRFEERVAALETERNRPRAARKGEPVIEKKKGPLARLFSGRETEKEKAKRRKAEDKASKGPRTMMQEQRIRERAIMGHQGTLTRQAQGKRDSRPDNH
jgi:hypothetical protein